MAAIGAQQIGENFGAVVGQIAGDVAGDFRAAEGGVLPRDSGFQPPGTLVQWAEPVTQGEYHAFIPRSGGKKAVETLSMAANDLGYTLVEFATGGRIVAASEFGGPGDPGTGSTGYRGDDLHGTMAFAELSNPGSLDFAAMGGLPYRSTVDVGYGGRSVTATKLDVGRGGPGIGGYPRAIDLWYETAGALGFSGLDLVELGGIGAGLGGTPAVTLPPPPSFNEYGSFLGPATAATYKYAYDAAAAFVAAHPPTPAVSIGGGRPPPPGAKIGSGYQSILDYLDSVGQSYQVTSTTGGKHAPGSYHYAGKAVDLVGDMGAIFDTLGPGGGSCATSDHARPAPPWRPLCCTRRLG